MGECDESYLDVLSHLDMDAIVSNQVYEVYGCIMVNPTDDSVSETYPSSTLSS